MSLTANTDWTGSGHAGRLGTRPLAAGQARYTGGALKSVTKIALEVDDRSNGECGAYKTSISDLGWIWTATSLYT